MIDVAWLNPTSPQHIAHAPAHDRRVARYGGRSVAGPRNAHPLRERDVRPHDPAGAGGAGVQAHVGAAAPRGTPTARLDRRSPQITNRPNQPHQRPPHNQDKDAFLASFSETILSREGIGKAQSRIRADGNAATAPAAAAPLYTNVNISMRKGTQGVIAVIRPMDVQVP